ncbi:MAG: hypothetical protein HC876_09365 [Chloroflexaceae bacterium]|nr:hypothetical protein [Chloroflexaceae bacterium]
MSEGRFTIPTRVQVTAEQRERLYALLRQHDFDLTELLTELLASFLDHLPQIEQEQIEPPPDKDDLAREIRERRAELRRLQARAVIGGDTAPIWVSRYIADLESELARLEARSRQREVEA